MAWVEIIHVRNPDATLSAMMQDFLQSIRRSLEQEGMVVLRVYGNLALSMDLSIHLYWSGTPPDVDGSLVGKRIVYQLRQHAVAINHSVWTEIEEFTRSKVYAKICQNGYKI